MHAKNACCLCWKACSLVKVQDLHPTSITKDLSVSILCRCLRLLAYRYLSLPPSIFPCDPVPFFFTSPSNTLDSLPLDFGLKDLLFTQHNENSLVFFHKISPRLTLKTIFERDALYLGDSLFQEVGMYFLVCLLKEHGRNIWQELKTMDGVILSFLIPTEHISGTNSNAPEMCRYIAYIIIYFKSKTIYKVSQKDCTFFKNSVVWWAPSWKFCAHGNSGYFNQN